MALWAFRFLLWYITILIVQPQNRFLFLYPLRIANLSILMAAALHIFSCMVEKRPVIRFGPATITGIVLFAMAFLSLVAGPMQTSTAWNAYIDMLTKNIIVMILIEAMVWSVQRAWAVYGTLMLATLWWIKGGVRLATAGVSHGGERLLGPAVSLVVNPNALAYMMCVMIPMYLYFYQAAENKYVRYAFLALSLAAVYITFKTGSRTGFLLLIALAIALALKFGRQHKTAFLVGLAASFFFFTIAGAMNIERFKTIPRSIKAFWSQEEKPVEELTQDEQSAQERRLKNRDAWRLIKDYPLLGAGISADETLISLKYPYATGQVHCEILMAGRQMGFIGMSLYIALIAIFWRSGRRVELTCKYAWPSISLMGWAIKIQCVMFVLGGIFSPIIWHPILMILVGMSSALWRALQREAAAVSLPAQVAASVPAGLSVAVTT